MAMICHNFPELHGHIPGCDGGDSMVMPDFSTMVPKIIPLKTKQYLKR